MQEFVPYAFFACAYLVRTDYGLSKMTKYFMQRVDDSPWYCVPKTVVSRYKTSVKKSNAWWMAMRDENIRAYPGARDRHEKDDDGKRLVGYKAGKPVLFADL